MVRYLWTAVRMLVAAVVLIAGYAAVETGLGQAFFHKQATGSIVYYHGHAIGAEMIGQRFTAARFFDSRPSAPGYNAAASTASNFGPTNPALMHEVRTNLAAFLKANPGVKANRVPPSMVESSDSGLDPDISPMAAYLQAPRVARVNHLALSVVRSIVRSHVRGRFLGMYGSPHVNVLMLNLALIRRIHGRS